VGAVPLGGGTDLLPRIRESLVKPATLVDLRRIPGSSDIRVSEDGALHVGASARMTQIARHQGVRDAFPALAAACSAVGSHQLRNMGTLGGNLCQRPRCWYYRQGFACHKNGGDSCPAVDGENQYHAIFGGGPCHDVHPSDPAVALLALDATVHLRGPGGDRSVAASDFFILPSQRIELETIVADGELVTAVSVPAHSSGGTQRYDKVMQRGAWDFALVSLAAIRRRNGDVRLVLGGVAPVPWRVIDSIEEDVASGGLSEDDIETLAQRALYDAVPLAHNGYKIELAATLLRRAIRELV
jgi:xanthine dehydrogenase YagS FAD-binding subunit